MAAPATTEQFTDLCVRSGILSAEAVEAYAAPRRTAGTLAAEPGPLAEALVADGLLTRFQADQLLKGRWRRFVIDDKYLLLDTIGTGGMGSVYLCEHRIMKRRVALKVLPHDRAKDATSLERFHREARAAATLDHPNIVRAHDVGRADGVHFLVMEFIDGVTLFNLVTRGGPLAPERAANYVAQVAQGLQHAHEAGLVHRDIKPGNLLLDRSGTVKILDMGLARFFADDHDQLTKQQDSGSVLGTADYLAPEQVLNSSQVDTRADIYSLGVTFYYLLTGKNPFAGGSVAQKLIRHHVLEPKPVREVRPEVPEAIAVVLHKMLQKDPAARYQAPHELVDALMPWLELDLPLPTDEECPPLAPPLLGNGPTSSRVPRPIAPRSQVTPRNLTGPRSRTPSPKAPDGRRRLVLGLSAAVALVACSATAWLLFGGNGTRDDAGGVAQASPATAPVDGRPPDNPTPPTPSVPEAGKPLPKATPPAPPKDPGEVIYRLAFDDRPPYSFRMRGTKIDPPGAAGGLPQPWWCGCFNAETLAEMALEEEDGKRLYSVRNLEGPASGHFVVGSGRGWFSVGNSYLVRVEYQLRGDKEAALILRQRMSHQLAHRQPMPTTGSEWKTVELEFLPTMPDLHVGLYNHATGENVLRVRNVEVFQLPGPAVARLISRPVPELAGATQLFPSPDGSLVLACGAREAVLAAADGSVVRTRFTGHEGAVVAGAVAPDGGLAMTAGADGTVRLWDGTAGKELRRLTGHTGVVRAVVFSPDGRYLLTGSDDKTARLWHAASGASVRELTGHGGTVTAVAIAPDGKTAATGSADGQVRVWDVQAGGLRHEFTVGGAVTALAAAGDGGRFLVGSRKEGGSEGALVLHRGEPGSTAQPLGDQSAVLAAALSTDGSRAAAVTADGRLRLWTTVDGVEVAAGSAEGLTSVVLVGDGNLPLTAGAAVQRWELAAATGPASSVGKLVYRLDLSGQRPFRQSLRKGGKVETQSGAGSLPTDWKPGAWGTDTLMECFAEEYTGSMALGLRNLEGQPSAMLFTPHLPLEEGRRYRVRVTYATAGRPHLPIRVCEKDQTARDFALLTRSDGAWRAVDFDLIPARSAPTRLEFHSSGGRMMTGGGNVLYLKGLEVREAGPGK